jgi:hypothetical protein
MRPGGGVPARSTVHGLYIEPTSLDLGEVWESAKHTVLVQVKNLSREVRTIIGFGTSCECSAVEPQKLTLGPGEAAELAVALDLTHRLPYQLGLARRPLTVRLSPVFKGDFDSTPGWDLTGVILSRVSLHDRPPVSRKVRARVHRPHSRVTGVAVPDKASVQVEEVAGSPGEYLIAISPRPDLPVGPFKFDVPVREVDAHGDIHPCASISVTGEMQPSFRVFPRVILLGEQHVSGQAEAEITVSLPGNWWTVERIETESTDTRISRSKADADGEVRLRVQQTIAKAGDQISPIRIVVRKPNGETETATVEVRYYGESSRR